VVVCCELSNAGDPPATLNGGLGGIAPGASGYFEVDLKNGHYALVSSNQETNSNDPSPLHTDFEVG